MRQGHDPQWAMGWAGLWWLLLVIGGIILLAGLLLTLLRGKNPPPDQHSPSHPITRRQLLWWTVAGAGLAAAGAAGLWSERTGTVRGTFRPGAGTGSVTSPEVLSSARGLLEVELASAPASLRIGDRRATVWAYNGSLPGPTLSVKPGDTLRVHMVNGLDEPTNLHVHGLHVSPAGNGDNPFVTITPGDGFDYEFRIPPDHPPGTYWYHPHHHGHVADQLAAGLYGAIIVEDPEELPVARERILVISDLSLDARGNVAGVSPMEQMMGREGEMVLVNGQPFPTLTSAPGQRERWRIINACPSRYLKLSLEGQPWRLLARDQGRLTEPSEVRDVDLAPGNRVELLVETVGGTATLVTVPVDRGSMPGMMGRRSGSTAPVDLLRLEVTGEQASPLPTVPAGPARRDLRDETVSNRRTLDFGMGGMGGAGGMGGMPGGMMAFTIDGREFDADRTDSPVVAGAIEEWTLRNSSPMDHPVHLHVWPMQVVAGADGADAADPLWLDVVNVPAFGRVTVRIPFEDVSGRSVYHCHILDHEDLGMMGTVEVR
ncbi:multicopper oxidase family protein [Corynebacterium comes]|uniref:Blue copper oxidase CueO n=1 Tax=Corynebacterium comes TaxID=2675218 RepID=A0A6B8VUU9_9CORY|nr:multicopper oxidase family protein [Corynebacterium comes]QGU03447.1 Blue copper oxidase CueO precursor [Corynebacterium comes]